MDVLTSAMAESPVTIPLQVGQLSFRTHSQLSIAVWMDLASSRSVIIASPASRSEQVRSTNRSFRLEEPGR